MERDWKAELRKFEEYLESFNIEKYSNFRNIKTVEQDLPNELIPLEIFYHYYWEERDFLDFDDLFKIYWIEKLNPHIYEFIKKYFYGCSIQFVEDGMKARLYRTLISVLTQFHFQYLWNALFNEKLESNADLDGIGIDALVNINEMTIALQIKKVSYVRMASSKTFAKRTKKYADVITEIPYIVPDMDEIERKLESSRTKEKTKNKLRKEKNFFNKYFVVFDNGFVTFKNTYLEFIYKKIRKILPHISAETIITFEEFYNID